MTNDEKMLEMLSCLVSKVESLTNKVESLTNDMKDVKQRLDNIEHNQEFHSAELEGLKFTNAKIHGNIKNIQAKIENLDLRFNDTQGAINVLSDRLFYTEKNVATLKLVVNK